VTEVVIRYVTMSGLENRLHVAQDDTRLNLQLRDIREIDLWPLVRCPRLKSLWLQYNSLRSLNLEPLASCTELEQINLSHNRLQTIDLRPLASCPSLRELYLDHNELRKIDVSPLFECTDLQVFKWDDHVALTADIFLRSVGSWPEVLIQQYHRILWTYGKR